MKNPTSIAAFEKVEPAGLVASRLREAGFDAKVRSEAHAPMENSARPREEMHRVLVPAEQSVRALSWCREFDAAEGLLSDALRCRN